MTYKDSADDGEEGSVAGSGEPKGAGTSSRWKPRPTRSKSGCGSCTRSRSCGGSRPGRTCGRATTPPDRTPSAAGSRPPRRTHDALGRLPRPRHGDRGPGPGRRARGDDRVRPPPGDEGPLLDLGVSACVEMRPRRAGARRGAGAGPELPAASRGGREAERSRARPRAPAWEPLLIRIERAIGARRRRRRCARCLPGFVALFRSEPLLYCPPSDGGKPHEVLRAQTALHVLEDLLTRLPRLGLLRETFQLTKLARQMEWNNPPDGRRVSSFDQLFRTALTGVVETLLVAAADWGEDAGPGRPARRACCSSSPRRSRSCGSSTASRCGSRCWNR